MLCDIRVQGPSQKSNAYLDGATPTKFGPKPLKSDFGPSFSKIDLSNKKKDSSVKSLGQAYESQLTAFPLGP